MTPKHHSSEHRLERRLGLKVAYLKEAAAEMRPALYDARLESLRGISNGYPEAVEMETAALENQRSQEQTLTNRAGQDYVPEIPETDRNLSPDTRDRVIDLQQYRRATDARQDAEVARALGEPETPEDFSAAA